MNPRRGYTLIELIIAVGLFALIMLLASGAYLLMIGLNRQAQATATGINNLSFALEAMTRDIRTGTGYDCGGQSSCKVSSFSFNNESGTAVRYDLSGAALRKTIAAAPSFLTDPSVTISSLTFYVNGATKSDNQQPRVTIIVSGTVSSGPGKTQPFTVETGATMRGTDL